MLGFPLQRIDRLFQKSQHFLLQMYCICMLAVNLIVRLAFVEHMQILLLCKHDHSGVLPLQLNKLK
jgi:hypothetical protein